MPRQRRLKVGLRFTLTLDNADQLPDMLRLIEDEDIDKFYLSHLVYAGRGNKNRTSDAAHETTRWAMDLLFEACWDLLERGRPKEFVTGNNDTDGVYLLRWVEQRFPTGQSTSGRNSPPGAAMLRASISPTSTISATFTRIPTGGTTTSATCGNGCSRRSGRTFPIRSWRG